MRPDLYTRFWNLLGLLLFAATTAMIFWEILPWGMAFVAPDALPFFPFANQTATLDNLLASGGEPTPHLFYWLTVHPLLANKLTYILDTLLLSLAGVYYLRTRGTSRASAWLGGLALGFSGYSFTLFSAGHRGYFHMMGCAVFAFALLAKCFQERRLFHFAMLGCVLAWGHVYQADVFAMVVMLAGAYTLWLTFAAASDPATRPWLRIRRVYPRFLLSLAVALAIGWPGLKNVIESQIKGRKETLAAVSPSNGETAAAGKEDKRAKWIFATNWSLPPKDMAEFIAPCLYGVDIVDQKHPYWGALGRPYEWQPGQRMMPNYRQHTVYLGAIQVCFMLPALVAWWMWRRRRRRQEPSIPADNCQLLADVPFWTGAGIVCLLLALGRYTPFYHLFYAIPYMDLVRCPVKFHHLVEICTAFLFGIGVEVWLRAQRAPETPTTDRNHTRATFDFYRVLRLAAIIAAAGAGLLLLTAGATELARDAVRSRIMRVGLGALADPLASYMISNLLRAAFLFGLAAILLWLGRRQAARMRLHLLILVLSLVVAVDLALVARRYVRPIDLTLFYKPNLVTQTILARSRPGVGVANYLTSNQTSRDWFSSALMRNGAHLVTPPADDSTSVDALVAAALGRRSDNPFGRRPETFWQTTRARFVIGSWSILEPLVKVQTLSTVLTFAVDPKSGALHTAQPAANTFLLAEYAERLPEAYVLDSWQGGLDLAAQLAALAKPDWDPAKRPVADTPALTAPATEARLIGETRVLSRRGQFFRLVTHIQATSPQPGLLVVDEPYADDLTARLDGQPVPLRRANALWCAVELPAGTHTVSIQRRRPPLAWTYLSALTGLLILLWGAFRSFRVRAAPTVARVAAVLALAVAAAGCVPGNRSVSVASELAALTNLMAFCEPPIGVSDMQSTYDRSGGNMDWWDIPRPVPGSTNLYEALKVEGPGCIKRIWQTNTPAREWRFYIDGESEPRLRLGGGELFGGGSATGYHPVQGGASGGTYSFLPIPFAKSIRVVLLIPEITANSRPYFHINYERYPSSARVTSWPVQMDAATTSRRLAVAAAWRQVAASNEAIAARMDWRRVSIPKEKSVDIFAESRGGTVCTLGVRPVFARHNAVLRSLLLRSLVVECYWDGADQPSVQVPLGDFFCNGLHPRQFASLPMANIAGAYLCRLPMPFRRQGRIVLRNDGPVDVELDTATEFTPGPVNDRLYLHAAFNTALGSQATFRVMRATGCGKYVGCYLMALSMDGGWNILEGDERFYRDGAAKPVHLGTGLEDYFNGGWYYYGLFELPLHGLLEKAAMRTAQYRFHLNDPVTFRQDLRLEWEIGGGPGSPAKGYVSAAAYWYQDKPGPSGSVLPPVGQRFPPLEQVGYLTIMAQLFELERMGLIEDAEERCAFYAGALQQMPERWLFELRRLAYREMRMGHNAIKADLSALAVTTNLPPEIVQQARLLQWRGEKPGRAIFGAHAYADYRLLVDGKLVGQGNDPFAWQAFPVELTPGEHLLQAEVIPRPQYAFFSAGFSSFFTNVISDTTWDYSRTKPDGWPAGVGDRSLWRPYENEPEIFPTMAWWRFVPNGIPCVQSGHQAGAPCPDWGTPPNQPIYLRRRIIVPETHPDRPPTPLRRTYDNTSVPVRPKDDTSNEGLSRGKQVQLP